MHTVADMQFLVDDNMDKRKESQYTPQEKKTKKKLKVNAGLVD